MNKRFLKFRYAAIRRYGEKSWTAEDGQIEFNPAYTVSCSSCEKDIQTAGIDYPYIVELSNGTKFLCFLHDFGHHTADEMLSAAGEDANTRANEINYVKAKEQINKLNIYCHDQR